MWTGVLGAGRWWDPVRLALFAFGLGALAKPVLHKYDKHSLLNSSSCLFNGSESEAV